MFLSFSIQVENFMTSVERTIEYAKIEPEAELDSQPGYCSLTIPKIPLS